MLLSGRNSRITTTSKHKKLNSISTSGPMKSVINFIIETGNEKAASQVFHVSDDCNTQDSSQNEI